MLLKDVISELQYIMECHGGELKVVQNGSQQSTPDVVVQVELDQSKVQEHEEEVERQEEYLMDYDAEIDDLHEQLGDLDPEEWGEDYEEKRKEILDELKETIQARQNQEKELSALRADYDDSPDAVIMWTRWT